MKGVSEVYDSTKKAIKKYREKNKSISIIFSKIFYDRIKKQADKDNSSVSSLIKTAVSEYLDKREQEMAQAKAQEKAQREQRKQEREQAKEEKKQAEQEAFKAAHAYDPTKDLPRPEKPVAMPEPLEPIDYRQRIAEQQRKEEEERRQREQEEQRKREEEEQRKAFERMQKQQALAQEEAQERAQEVSRRSRPLPAQPTDNAKPRTIDVQAEAVRPVDKKAEELTQLELMKRYDRYGKLRLTFLGSNKKERYLAELRKMHEEATRS